MFFHPFTGDLIARHMHIFKMNEFFRGVVLPQPESPEPLEMKLAKEVQRDPNCLDFLKVITFAEKLYYEFFMRFFFLLQKSIHPSLL